LAHSLLENLSLPTKKLIFAFCLTEKLWKNMRGSVMGKKWLGTVFFSLLAFAEPLKSGDNYPQRSCRAAMAEKSI